MTFVVRRPVWALALALCACGAAEAPRTQPRTPEPDTGQARPALPRATVVPTATPEPEPEPQGGPVTPAEERVIRGWSTQLRHGNVAAAARYFALPSLIANLAEPTEMATRGEIEAFNATLTCGAKLLSTRRMERNFVIGTFELTELPGRTCGASTGKPAAVAFLIRDHRISHWIRTQDVAPEVTPAPTGAVNVV